VAPTGTNAAWRILLMRCQAHDQTDDAADKRTVPESVRPAEPPHGSNVRTREANRQGASFEVGCINGLQDAAEGSTAVCGQDLLERLWTSFTLRPCDRAFLHPSKQELPSSISTAPRVSGEKGRFVVPRPPALNWPFS
jgi:hypothetical protein